MVDLVFRSGTLNVAQTRNSRAASAIPMTPLPEERGGCVKQGAASKLKCVPPIRRVLSFVGLQQTLSVDRQFMPVP
ncbi:MAG: hypothetical protein CMJ64_23540 [Planctomycetaceae bacterium]|nr:hypothetical protein [Planctomycetaceae bacterium]